MGKFMVRTTDHTNSNKVYERVFDGQWNAHISVWSEDMVTSDNRQKPECTGNCTVSVYTMKKEPGRSGNKVKILTLSVRECV